MTAGAGIGLFVLGMFVTILVMYILIKARKDD
jgi:hypothetical protein